MPKMKTHSGAKKRYSLTATGKVKYARPNRSHFMTNKSKNQKRKLRKGSYIAGKNASNIKTLLCK
ncbi:MAG: 50S ribosomal protein L35 [Clostridiales bacterium]|nr:50S ribosomal protein L35 [Clostridiales bacterium]